MKNIECDRCREIPEKTNVRLTLAPIARDGRNCLVCHDVEGTESLTLMGVMIYYDGTPWQRVIREADDIFELVEAGIFSWPAADQILGAEFLARLKNGKSWWVRVRAGRKTLSPSNGFGWERENEWLEKRGFLTKVANG